MLYLVKCFENGKCISNIYHDDRNMAKDMCRIFVERKPTRAASVFIKPIGHRTDDYFGTEKGYIYNEVSN